jgi:hypothetical protein
MARRAKEAAADPTHNMSAEQIEEKRCEFLEHAIVLEKELVAARAVVKGISAKIGANKTAYEKHGGAKVDYDWYLVERKRDPEDRDAEIRRRNRIARAMKLPIGTQLGIFEDGDSVATKIDNDAGGDFDDPEKQGYAAALAGKTSDDNPHDDGSPGFLKWNVGFNRGIEAGVKAAIKAA